MPAPLNHLDELSVYLHRRKGTYAVLIAAGVSKAAGMPSGWDVAYELTAQLAASAGHPNDPNTPEGKVALEQWYKSTHGDKWSYSTVVALVACTQALQRNTLEKFFVPTDDERIQGLKQPTRGHLALAHLIKGGYIRVVLTPNFDDLLEQALLTVGVTKVVLP